MVHAAVLLGISTLFALSAWTQEGQRATIVVQLPVAADLYIDGALTRQTGPQRTLTTPPLEFGYTYYFTLRAELEQQGEIVRASKKIGVRPGERTTVDLLTPIKPPKTAPVLPPDVGNTALSRAEEEVIALTNKERQAVGLPPLKPNSKLAQAAREHSLNMAKQQKMDHVLDDRGPSDRIRALGYQGFSWGENIAYGMPTPAQAVQAWMTSEGHRANILGQQYSEIGVGIAHDSRGIPYYTQVFGQNAGAR